MIIDKPSARLIGYLIYRILEGAQVGLKLSCIDVNYQQLV